MATTVKEEGKKPRTKEVEEVEEYCRGLRQSYPSLDHSELPQIEAKRPGICAPFRFGIPLGKRHSLGVGGFLWMRPIN